MGWSGGTDICIGIWEVLRLMIPVNERVNGLVVIIKTLENHDWDGVDELRSEKWPELEEALKICGWGE